MDNSLSKKSLILLVVVVISSVVLITINYYTIKLLSAGRAYTSAESRYAKGESDAIINIYRYIDSKDSVYLQKFNEALETNYGARDARLGLLSGAPDAQIAEAFDRGGNHKHDIDDIIWLSKNFLYTPWLRDALNHWNVGDSLVAELKHIGDQIAHEIKDGTLDSLQKANYIDRIESVKESLKVEESGFLAVIGETNRKINDILFVINMVLVFLIFGSTAQYVYVMFRRYSEQNKKLIDTNQNLDQLLEEQKFREKQAQHLQDEYRKLSLVAQKSHNGVLITNTNLEIEWVNESFQKMSGFQLDDVTGMNVRRLFFGPETDEVTVEEIKGKLLNGKPVVHELMLYNKSRKRFWLKVDMTPVLNDDGEVTKIIFMHSDITSEKEEEERMKMLETAIEITEDMMVITKINQNSFGVNEEEIIYVNKAFTQITGYTFEEIKEHSMFILRGKNTQKTAIRVLSEALHYERVVKDVEIINYKKDGTEFWMGMTVYPLKNEEGRTTHLISVNRDITELKNQEKRIMETIIDTQESERKRIAQDLHDGLGQLLVASHMNLNAFRSKLDEDEVPYSKVLTRAEELLKESISESRNISYGLLSKTLQGYGLYDAILEIVNNVDSGDKIEMKFETNIKNGQRFPERLEVNIFRVVQELSNNMVKYSGANKATLILTLNEDNLYLRMRENGIGIAGIENGADFKGAGLQNIQTRVKSLGGTITMKNLFPQGLETEIIVPRD